MSRERRSATAGINEPSDYFWKGSLYLSKPRTISIAKRNRSIHGSDKTSGAIRSHLIVLIPVAIS